VNRLTTVELSIKEAKVTEADGLRLLGHAEAVLPDGLYQDGMPDPGLGFFIRDLLDQAQIQATNCRVAISEAGVAVRDFRLPRIPRGELASAVLFEGKRLVPIDPEGVFYAWHARPDRDGYAVYLVAARREMVDGLIVALGSAGLTVDRIDLKPLALARGAGVWDGLLLEWGAGEATLVLMADGRPRFFRTFVLDAPDMDAGSQFEEIVLSVNALVRFMRSAQPPLALESSTPLVLAGRFAFLGGAEEQARHRFEFSVRYPAAPQAVPAGFPWQAHLSALGLLAPSPAAARLTPSQGGDTRVAA
jgi:hypothetical protein